MFHSHEGILQEIRTMRNRSMVLEEEIQALQKYIERNRESKNE